MTPQIPAHLYDPCGLADGNKPPQPSVDEELREMLWNLHYTSKYGGLTDWQTADNHVKAAFEAITNRIEAAKQALAEEERSHENTLKQRDYAEEWADRLAYAIGRVEVIGEHSSSNNPWARALAILQSTNKQESK